MHDLKLGAFIVPNGTDGQRTLAQIEAAESSGLDLVGIQDHPYQRRYLDTWTLLAYAAARTSRIGLLSGGRVELGIGAGALWEAVEAMGGPRRTPGESVEALEEAIAIIRGYWSGERSLTLEGRHYYVRGAKPGPPPAHPIGLWVGAYGPRMLRLTGRLADGWIPSLGDRPYMPAEDVPAMQAAIDESARRAGRDPQQIVRAVNVVHPEGEPGGWTEPLARVATELRFTTVLVGIEGEDPVGAIRRLGEDVAPRVRELVGRG